MKVAPKPEAIGFSEQGLQCAYGILQEAVDRDELMGGVLQVSRGGSALPVACFGRRELREGGRRLARIRFFSLHRLPSRLPVPQW